MQVNYTELTKFIAGETVFVIPSFQRNYEWKKEHCEQLFEDIEKISHGEKPEHFIGTIIFQKPESEKYIIIDGQQRLTSFLLLVKAIQDITGSQKYLFKLQPSEFDREILDKIMSGKELSEQEKSSRLYQNYNFFKEKLKDNASVIHDVLNKIKIVSMELGNENPQEIFESLNSTGKDLTETELIKNFLLMDLDSVAQEYFYKEYWLATERLLKNSETVEKFMFHYLVAKRKSITDMQGRKNIHISKQALYYTFKRYFQKNYSGDKKEQSENFLKDMHRHAEFYSRLLFDDATDFYSLSPLNKKFYELVFWIDSDSAPIILMYLNERYENGEFNEATFEKFVDALISFMFRAKVCRSTSVDTVQNAGNILSRLDGNLTVDNFWDAVVFGKGKFSFPKDKEFQRALTSPDLNDALKGDGFKYLLYALERQARPEKTLPDYFNTAVDYIMPKKITNSWKKYLADKNDLQRYEFWLGALGNLALVEENKTGRANFADKKIIYAQSKFFYTNELKNLSDWTSKQIKDRSRKLADLALKIWFLPEKYNVELADENMFYFNSRLDFGFFTGKKPATVSISGEEKPIKTWINLFYEVATSLCELDRSAFVQAIQQDNVPRAQKLFSTSTAGLIRPLKIAEGCYVESNFDTKSCLRITTAIVENFDRLSHTNFKDEIWFTLID